MSEHIGTIGERISCDVTLVNDYSYTTNFGYGDRDNYIYTMQDAEGNVLVWKTTMVLIVEISAEKFDCIHKGDTMQITGTVKEHSEYKGTKQTVLTRCKFSLIAHKSDEKAIKREQQILSLKDGDFIWEMPYRQYKEHYSDCETVAGSYKKDEYLPATIEVIIRAGRLKNSGVRGQHFSGYVFFNRHRGKGFLPCGFRRERS